MVHVIDCITKGVDVKYTEDMLLSILFWWFGLCGVEGLQHESAILLSDHANTKVLSVLACR